MHPQDVLLIDSDMRVSSINVHQSNNDATIGDATVTWELLDMDRVSLGSGVVSLRLGTAATYDGLVPVSILETLTLNQKYILKLVAIKSGRQRTIEKVAVIRRGFNN